ncbi:hypothetical protein quinque_008723 [Culex quinquefasciatus]
MLRRERQPELRVGAEVLNDTKAASGILMCEAIVDRLGQVSPNLHKVCDYNSNMVNLQEVLFEKHFDERFLNGLRTWKRLKALCAGIWHNLVLAACAYLLFMATPAMLSAVYRVNDAIMVTGIKDGSPLLGTRGLEQGDIITSINSCDIRNEGSWYGCMLESLHSQPSYCISSDFVHLNDESVPISHKSDGFEYMEDINAEDVALPQHMCLNFRKVIENSFAYRHHQPTCPEGHCSKPMINNFTTIMQIRRDRKPDVIYIGHTADLTRTIRISQFVPKIGLFLLGSSRESPAQGQENRRKLDRLQAQTDPA